MGGVQTYLAVGAVILFTLLILNVNNLVSTSQDVTINNEAYGTAAALTNALADEISAKSFDQSTINGTVLNYTTLTAPGSLGKETGEAYPNFNDIDDYNNYTKNDTTPRTGVYNLKVKVNYVDSVNLATVVNSKSRVKMITIAAYNSSMPDTFKLFTYKAY